MDIINDHLSFSGKLYENDVPKTYSKEIVTTIRLMLSNDVSYIFVYVSKLSLHLSKMNCISVSINSQLPSILLFWDSAGPQTNNPRIASDNSLQMGGELEIQGRRRIFS